MIDAIVIDNDHCKTKEHMDSSCRLEIPSFIGTIFVASMKCFNKYVQCMLPSLVTAVETPVKYLFCKGKKSAEVEGEIQETKQE